MTGRVVDAMWQRKDIELYRAANCNFVRTSHYPPCEEMLDICDELGMFVEVESPVCWVGHHANENWKTLNYQDSQYYPYILQANMETIHFIVIILLSCFGLWPMSLIGIKNLPKYKNMCIKLILLVRIRFTTRRMEALIIREVRLLLQIFIIPDLMAIR